MQLRVIWLVCAVVTLGGRAAFAQTVSPPLPAVAVAPTNVLLPNYNGVPIGEIGGLEVGAFLARANDSSAAFYNPAGLTRAEQTSVSGTAGVFQFGAVSADAVGESAHSFQQVPAMFAFVLKDPLGHENLAAGLSIARTTAWQQTVDFARTTQTGTATDRMSYSSAATLDSWLASVGLGFKSAGKWRAGFSLDGQFTSSERRQALADQYSTPNGLTALSISSRSEAGAAHLRLTGGVQYQLTPSWIAGAVVRTRGFGIRSTGLAMLEGVSSTGTTTTTGSFFDSDPDVTYRVPSEFKTGLAYTGKRAEAEVDLLVFAGAGEYQAYSSNQPVTIVIGSAGTAPSATDYKPVAPVIDSTAVVNVAIGGHLNLTSDRSWIVHGGYAADGSPVGEHDTVFTKVNLQKITAGVSGRTTHFLGSIGVQYVTGESGSIPLRDLPSGQLTTTFKVKSLGMLYSLSVMF
jgi:hypothetical protein